MAESCAAAEQPGKEWSVARLMLESMGQIWTLSSVSAQTAAGEASEHYGRWFKVNAFNLH